MSHYPPEPFLNHADLDGHARVRHWAEAILRLASWARVSVERHEVVSRLVGALRVDPNPLACTLRVGEDLGLRLHVAEMPLRTLFAGGGQPVGPLVALSSKQDRPIAIEAPATRWWLPPALRRIRVWAEDSEVIQTLGRPRLMELLEVTSSDATVRCLMAEPRRALEPVKGEVSPTSWARALIQLERDDLGVVFVYAIGVGLLSIAAPLGVQALVNSVAFGAMLQPIAVLTLVVSVLLLCGAILRATQAYTVERIQERLFVRIALEASHRLMYAPAGPFGVEHGPERLNRFFEVVTLQKGAATLLVEGTSVLLQTIVGLVLLAVYSPYLLGLDLLLIAALVIAIGVLGRGAIRTAIDESKAKYTVAAWLQEVSRHVVALRFQSANGFVQQRVEALVRDWVHRRRAHFSVVLRQYAFILVVQALATAALFGIGGALVVGRQLSVGQLVAAELVLVGVVANFAKAGKYLETYYDMVASLDKVGHLLDVPCVNTLGVALPTSNAGLAIQSERLEISTATGVMEVPSLDIAPGRRVGFVMSTEQAREPLIHVLGGLAEPTAGRIEFDGVDLRDLSASSMWQLVAVVRGSEVFAGSVAENIATARPGMSRQELRRTLESLGLWSYLSSLPRGLDTAVGTYGDGVSPGLARLITLARAALGGPRLLVLDGVLDGLDDQARTAVRRALSRLPDCTVLIATSDERMVDWCDEVHRVQSGRAFKVLSRTMEAIAS